MSLFPDKSNKNHSENYYLVPILISNEEKGMTRTVLEVS